MSSEQQLSPLDPEQSHLREERRAARVQRRRERGRAKLLLWGTIGSILLLLGLIGFIDLQIQQILAFNAAHPPINGVTCDRMEQGGYHIHVHLSIYVNGHQVAVPKGIGIAADGRCFYWLHTHTSDGLIHIEAPAKLHNTALDDFLTIWHDGFGKLGFPAILNQQTGWKIYVNGRPFPGPVTSPLHTEVPLVSHDVITLEYGSHNPPPETFYIFPPNLTR